MIFFALFIADAALGQTFFDGFIQGLRLNTAVQSSCLNDIDATEYAATVFVSSLSNSNSTISGRIHNFQTMVNIFTNTATVCKLQSLTNNIEALILSIENYSKGVFDPYAIYLTTKLPQITNYWKAIQSSNDEYDKGYYSGLEFALVFRYNI